MIGLDAYRLVIGAWLFKTQKKQKLRNTSLDAEPRSSLNIYFLMILRLLILGILSAAVSNTIRVNSRMIREEENSLMPPQSLQTQLIVGNVELHPGPANNLCDFCGARFTRNANLKRHVDTRHLNNVNIRCRICNANFVQLNQWKTHMNDTHKPQNDNWIKIKEAFDGKVLEIAHIYGDKNLEEALGNDMLESVLEQLRYYLRLHGQIRYNFNFGALMRRQGIGETIEETFYFTSPAKSVIFGELSLAKDVDEDFKVLRERVLDLNVDFEGSGWSFLNAEIMTITITKLKTHGMGSHVIFRPRNEKGNMIKAILNNTINVKNQDDKCALYNIVLSKFFDEIQGEPSEPASLEKFLSRIDTYGVDFPVTEADLSILEQNNKDSLNIAIHVWRYVNYDHVEPFYISRNKKKSHTNCDMLLVEGTTLSGERTQHLIHIKDRAALFRRSLGNSQQRKMRFFCSSCQLFRSDSFDRMEKHHKMCRDPGYVKSYYPPEKNGYTPYDGNVLRPPNSYRTSLPVLRGIFDFETAHVQEPEETCLQCTKIMEKLTSEDIPSFLCPHTNKRLSYTSSSLPPICFSLIMLNNKNEKVFEKYHVGMNSAQYLIQLLVKKQKDFMEYIDRNEKMRMSKFDVWRYNKATNCQSCNKEFGGNIVKVRDHCHFTGAYRAALCGNCNLQKKNQRWITYLPVHYKKLHFQVHSYVCSQLQRIRQPPYHESLES